MADRKVMTGDPTASPPTHGAYDPGDKLVDPLGAELAGGVDADYLNRQLGPNLSGDPSSDFVISDGGSGTIDISAGTAFIREGSGLGSKLVRIAYAGETGVALPVDPGENWVYLDYNSGSPVVGVTTGPLSINLQSQLVIGRVYRIGSALNIWNVGQHFENYGTRACFKDFEVFGAQRASGLILGEAGTRNVTVTAGAFYCSHNRTTTPSVDTSGADSFSVWNSAASTSPDATGVTQVDNQQYWNGSALANLANNRYGSRFFYMDFDGDLHMQYGVDNIFNSGRVLNSDVPTPPDFLRDFAIYIGRVVIQEDGAAFFATTNPFQIAESGSIVTDHGDLSGLSDDDHPEYMRMVRASDVAGLSEDSTPRINDLLMIERASDGTKHKTKIGDFLAGWLPYPEAISRISDTSFSVTDNPLAQDTFKPGRPIYAVLSEGAGIRFLLVTGYSSGTVTVAGGLPAGITNTVFIGDFTRVIQKDFNIPGSMPEIGNSTLLSQMNKTAYRWQRGRAHIVRVMGYLDTADTGGTAATINASVEGSDALLTALSVASDKTWVASTNEIHAGNATIDQDDDVELEFNPGSSADAADLTVSLAFILE